MRREKHNVGDGTSACGSPDRCEQPSSQSVDESQLRDAGNHLLLQGSLGFACSRN